MSNEDDWPQAEILRKLPATANLNMKYDTDSLRNDLSQVVDASWSGPRAYSGQGLEGQVTASDWTSLSLRSIGGDYTRTDPGGPSLAEFAGTKWLEYCPYIASIIESFPARLRSVRLMSLGPGAESPWHLDTKIGLPWGKLRLHIPITVPDGAELLVQDETHRWQPGGLYYADFSRMHKVRNTSDTARVHLVLDSHVSPEVMVLFPEEFLSDSVKSEVVQGDNSESTPVILTGDGQARIRFQMPRSFLAYDQPNDGFLSELAEASAEVREDGGAIFLYVDGERKFELIPVGDGEMRIAGWTRERTIRPTRTDDGSTSVELTVRTGGSSWSRQLMATGD